jgi:light-regulated signal transduction histidine kinase (bacteriophytochrome)
VKGGRSRLVYGRRGSDVYGSAQAALRRDILLAVLVSALAIAAAFVFANRMTAPIRRLAARLADDRGSPNDIGVLERGIDRLDRVIEESEVELARRAERLQQLNAGLEERVRLRTAELQRANDELEAFSYSVSHDLRAPLRAIDGFTRIVIDDCADDVSPDVQRHLQLISKNTQDMGQLIDGLLAFSRLGQQPLGKRTLDVDSIAREVASLVEGEHPGRPSEISIAALPEANADPTLVRQVFANLLSNAIKYTRSTETPAIEVASYQDNGWPVYLVRDNGVGFDMRYANKLFTVFQRLHRVEDYEGTGIGLALVSRIVSRHGGRIWAEAKPDEGATFYFTLQGEAG